MKSYIPPEGSDDGDSEENDQKRTKRAKKDKNAPKGALTAYFVFANDVRGKVWVKFLNKIAFSFL